MIYDNPLIQLSFNIFHSLYSMEDVFARGIVVG